ncbi:MAG TPA: nucleotidyltransferase family protein [Syntrophales bacterium]|nr:nucleotidyltransferase family protein [Syntrophales bacterium]
MTAISDRQAAILVGGLGARLRSVVSDRPKVLADILGRPFLTYLLEQLRDAGVSRIVLCTGYRSDQVEAAFGPFFENVSLIYSREITPLGTAGAIKNAEAHIGTDCLLVMNGDSYIDLDLDDFLQWHDEKKASASILLARVEDTSRYGRVQADEEGCITGFEEKGAHDGPGWINAGVYLLRENFIQSIPSGLTVSMEKEMFPSWIGKGLYGYRSEGRFIDIGIPEDYLAAEQFFRRMEQERKYK